MAAKRCPLTVRVVRRATLRSCEGNCKVALSGVGVRSMGRGGIGWDAFVAGSLLGRYVMGGLVNCSRGGWLLLICPNFVDQGEEDTSISTGHGRPVAECVRFVEPLRRCD